MKHYYKKTTFFLFSFLIFFFTTAATAQTIVRGIVTDEIGEPLAGATILLKGSQTGTTTTSEGKFSINVSGDSDVLIFSFIGFKKQEIKIGKQREINIVLRGDSESLDEVIVTAYSDGVRQRDISGALSKAKMSDLLSAPVGSIDNALAGRLAGVLVTSGDGSPGGTVNIIVRGNNSLTQDNSPLYVIDGFPMEGNPLSSINPNDIESLTVLKDASSTAIYGARGANGVVLVNTKKGAVGKVQITYQGDFAVENITQRMKLLSAYEFVKLQSEVFDPQRIFNERYFPTGSGFTTAEDYRNAPTVDWQERMFRTAFVQNHSLSLSGGTQSTYYIMSLSYRDQGGIVTNSGYDRVQGRINLTQRINSKLKANIVVNYSQEKRKGSSANLRNSWGYRSVAYPGEDLHTQKYIYEPDGINVRFNPIISQENEFRRKTSGNLYTNGSLEYEIIKGLKLKVSGGITNNKERQEAFNGSNTISGNLIDTRNARGINANIRHNEYNSWLNENTLAYQIRLKQKHNISVLAGLTMQGNRFSSTYAEVYQISNESLGMGGFSAGIPSQTTTSISSSALMSYLSRFNYSYKSLYMFTASFRADGSSKFYGKNRWGYFPSTSVAWNVAEENFWKKIGLKKYVSNAKLRLSWGLTGNNRVGDFAALPTYITGKAMEYSFNNAFAPGYIKNNLGNMGLKWETTSQSNIGLDLGFLKQRIRVTTDLYYKTTNDLLLNAELPLSMGFDRVMKNIGKVSNKGLEITIDTENIKRKDFTWNTSFNISFNKSEVKALADNQQSLLNSVGTGPYGFAGDIPSYISKIGQPMGMMYGHVYEGTYKYSDFDRVGEAYVLKRGIAKYDMTIQPGYPKYKDLNNDGIIDNYDRTIIGDGQPKAIGGISNHFAYKNFELNIFFQWSLGNDIYNVSKLEMLYPTYNQRERNMMAEYANRWTPENPNSDIPLSHMHGNFPSYYSTAVVEDGSYIRLKTASLTYNLPDKILKKVSLRSASVVVSGNNLLTFTNYTGLDPESSSFGQTLTPGYDFAAYPRSRTFNVSLKLGF